MRLWWPLSRAEDGSNISSLCTYRRAISWVIVVFLIDVGIIYLLSASFLSEFKVNFSRHYSLAFTLYGLLIVTVLYAYVLYTLFIAKPDNIFRHLTFAVKRHCLNTEKLVFSFPVLALIPAEKAIFVAFKSRIPEIRPFQYDTMFFHIDRILHANFDPWELLQPLLGGALITQVIAFLYHYLWFVLFVVVVLWHALGTHSLEVRLRFFVSYIAIWLLLGSLAAVYFSSAGPCYFDKVTGLDSPYQPLMNYLNLVHAENPLISLALQEDLWDGHVNGTGYGGGVSAMPAMHVALVMLFTLSAWQVNRKLGAAFVVYLALVVAGSIHLGWHYAIDAYFAIPCTWLIWRTAGWLLARDKILQPSPSA